MPWRPTVFRFSPARKRRRCSTWILHFYDKYCPDSLCSFPNMSQERANRQRKVFVFVREVETRLWDSIKPVGYLCRPQHRCTAWGSACSIFPATAWSLGERFWHKSGNYLLIWSPKELRARLTAKEKEISRESSTAVQRLQLLEGLESNVSKQPAVPIEVNFFRHFSSQRWVFWLRLVLLFLCSSLRFGGVYWLGLTQWNISSGEVSAEQKRESESRQNRLSLGRKGSFWKQHLTWQLGSLMVINPYSRECEADRDTCGSKQKWLCRLTQKNTIGIKSVPT